MYNHIFVGIYENKMFHNTVLSLLKPLIYIYYRHSPPTSKLRCIEGYENVTIYLPILRSDDRS